jgi:hypothetical protein
MPEIPTITVEQAWMNLAGDILELAIEDVRQEHDPAKSYKSKQWLLSPVARYLFEFLLPDLDINIEEWVLAGCPILGKRK